MRCNLLDGLTHLGISTPTPTSPRALNVLLTAHRSPWSQRHPAFVCATSLLVHLGDLAAAGAFGSRLGIEGDSFSLGQGMLGVEWRRTDHDRFETSQKLTRALLLSLAPSRQTTHSPIPGSLCRPRYYSRPFRQCSRPRHCRYGCNHRVLPRRNTPARPSSLMWQVLCVVDCLGRWRRLCRQFTSYRDKTQAPFALEEGDPKQIKPRFVESMGHAKMGVISISPFGGGLRISHSFQ